MRPEDPLDLLDDDTDAAAADDLASIMQSLEEEICTSDLAPPQPELGFLLGSGALAIASVLLYPKTLGGCAVFSGSVPLSKSFADRVTPEARKTPVLWFHGMADGVVLFEAGHAGCAFLQGLGMACEFKTYPTLGHLLVDEELQYFRRWIFDHLGISQGTKAARPSSSSSSNHEDLH